MQLGLRAVVQRPVVALGERVAVVVVRDVDPAAGIGVLQPRAADVGVLVEHDVGHAGLLPGGRRRRCPDMPAPMMATWNGAVGVDVVLVPRGAPAGRPCSASSSRIIGRYSSISAGRRPGTRGSVAGRRRSASARRRCRRRGTRSSVCRRQLADGRLLLGRQAALVLAHQQRVDAQVGAQQREVAGDVGQRRQQGRAGRRPRARRGSRRRSAVIGWMGRASAMMRAPQRSRRVCRDGTP